MLLHKQLELFGDFIARALHTGTRVRAASESKSMSVRQATLPPSGQSDVQLEQRARELLQSVGALKLVPLVRVVWSSRLRTAAGRAEYHRTLVTLNPLLREHGEAEIDRTLRHELAHLVAHARCGRRRIAPHGLEWRKACRDLGIGDEPRCHTLPFPRRSVARPFLYRCPECAREFPRVRRIRRRIACLACCRRHNRGQFDSRFTLRLVRQAQPSTLSRVQR